VIERAPFAGGLITFNNIPYFDGVARRKDGAVMTPGIPIELLVHMGVCKPDAKVILPHNVTIDSLERLKMVIDRLFQAEPNLQVLYHTFAVDAVVKGDRIAQVLLGTKAGLLRIEAGIVIDATGDGDISAWAGVPLDDSNQYMPLSLHSRIGNVNVKPEICEVCTSIDPVVPGLSDGELRHQPFSSVLKKAYEEGRIGDFYGPLISFRYAPNEAHIQATRIPANATDAEDLTRAEMQGRADAWNMFELWKQQVPGFESSYLISTGPTVFVRETRRIKGQYILTEQDVRAGTDFADAVATGSWYMDLHPNYTTPGSFVDWKLKPEGPQDSPAATTTSDVGFVPSYYDIPYRTLLPRNVVNLLVPGRCHSATRLAASSTRVAATGMAMGQAAGVAAAMAVRTGRTVQELDGQKVRERLEEKNAGPFAGPK
jgi:hypothetical protein